MFNIQRYDVVSVWVAPHGLTDLVTLFPVSGDNLSYWIVYALAPMGLYVLSRFYHKVHWPVLLAASCVHFHTDWSAPLGVVAVALAAALATCGYWHKAEDVMIVYLSVFHVPGHYVRVYHDNCQALWVAAAGTVVGLMYLKRATNAMKLMIQTQINGTGAVLAVGFIVAHTYVVLQTLPVS